MTTSRQFAGAHRLSVLMAALLAAAGIAAPDAAVAADVVKDNNTTNLNLGSSWVGGTAPGTGDVGVWDSTVTAANSVVLGANLSWQGLRLASPGGDVTLTGTNTLTLGSAGLDTGSVANLTYQSSGTITLNGTLAGSTTLTIDNNVSKGWTGMNDVTFTGTLVLRGGSGASGAFSGNWISFGNNSGTMSQTGAFALDTGASLTDRGEFIVTFGWGDGTSKPKLTLSSLTGFGDFRSDFGTNSFRTVLVDQDSDTTFAGRFVNSNSERGFDIEKAGTGTLTLTGANTNRNTTVTAGTLQIGNGGTSGQIGGGASVAAGATLAFNRSNDLTYASVISGAGSLTKAGAGSLTLSGANTFSGSTTVSNGTLVVGNALALQNSTVTPGGIAFSSAVAGNAFTFGGLSGSQNLTLENNAGTPDAIALTVGGNNANTTYSGDLSGAGSLTKSGTGILTLAGTNDYFGGTTVNGGYLVFDSTGARPATGTVNVGADGGLGLRVGSAAGDFSLAQFVDLWDNNLSGVSMNSSASAMIVSDVDNTISSPLEGARGLRKSGTGTLTLSASNTYTGTTTITAGTLQVGTGGTTGTLGTGSVSIASGAELIFNRSNQIGSISNAFSGDGTIALRGGTGSANSFSGNWIRPTNTTDSFSSPTLHLDTGASLTNRGEVVFDDVWGNGGDKPKFQLASLSGWGDFRSDVGGTGNRTISVTSTGTHEYQGRIVQANAGTRSIHFEKLGSGTQIFSGENAYQNTIVGGGKLQIGNGGTTGNIGLGTVSVASDATLEFNRSNLIDYKASARMRNVSGEGDIVINGGAKFFNYPSGNGFNDANSWNNFSGNLIIKGGSEFQTIRNGRTAMGTAQIVLGDASTSGKLSQIEGNWTWTNNISLVGSANEILNNATGGDRWNKIQGVISGDGNVTFANPGGGMNNGNLGFILTGTNTMSGTVTVDTFVRVGGITGENTSTAAGTGGTLGTANVVINSGRRLTFSRSNAHTVANSISGAGSVFVGATGITGTETQNLTLSGTNTYTGATAVNTGTLNLTGSLAAESAVSIASGAILAGTGTAAGTVTLASGGILSPGVANAGTLSLGSLVFSDTATIEMPVSAGGTLDAQLAVADTVAASGGSQTVTFDFGSNLFLLGAGTYSLISHTGGSLANFDAFTVAGTAGGRQSLDLVNTASAINLNVGNAFVTWSGADGSGWSADDNWILSSTTQPTTFEPSDIVVFTDSGEIGEVALTNPVNPLTVTFSNDTLAYVLSSDNASGITTGSLLKQGTGSVTINTANSFAGGTQLTAGALVLGNATALGTGSVDLEGGTLDLNGQSIANAIVLAGGSLATKGGSVSGVISEVGDPRGIVVADGLTLTAANTYSGGTTLASGVLRIGNDAALGTGTLTINGGAVTAEGATARALGNSLVLAGNVQFGSSGDTGNLRFNGTVDLGGETRTIDSRLTTNQGVRLNGVISDGGLILDGDSNGILTLSGNNTYASGTTVTAGRLAVGSGGSAGTAGSGSITVAEGAEVIFNRSNDFTVSNVLSGSGTFTKAGGGRMTVNGDNSGGPLNWNFVGTGNGDIGFQNANAIGGVGSTITLAANATGSAFLSTNGNTSDVGISLGTGAVFTWNGSTGRTNTLSGIISGAGGLTKVSGETLVLTGANTFSGPLSLTGGGILEIADNGVLGGGNYAGQIGLSSRLVVNTTANQTFSGTITGTSRLDKSNSGTLTLTGNNGFSGGTELLDGILAVTGLNGIGTGYLAVKNGATFSYRGSGSETTTRNLFLDLGASRIDVTEATGFLTWNDAVAKTGAFTKGGAGALAIGGAFSGGASVTVLDGSLWLGGASTYNGPTTVTGGTLLVNGSLGSGSAVTVEAAGTLGGSGTIGGATTIFGTHSPGTSPGVQTFGGDLSYDGATVIWELAGNTATQTNPAVFDQVIVGGNLDFTSATSLALVFNEPGSSVNWADSFWGNDQEWLLYDVTGTTSNFTNLSISTESWLDGFDNSFSTERPQAAFGLRHDTGTGDVFLTYVAVPEPGTLALAAVAFGLAGWSFVRRRRA